MPVLAFKEASVRSATDHGNGAVTEYTFANVDGLILSVLKPTRAGSTKSWVVRYSLTSAGRRISRKQKIGRYPSLGLAGARAQASAIRAEVEQGQDPFGSRRARAKIAAQPA